MLAIRLVAEPVSPGPLALPVRPCGTDTATGPSAEPAPVPTELSTGLAAGISALLPEIEQLGQAGRVYRWLRPTDTPTRLFLFGVGDGAEADWRSAGAALARAAAEENSVTVVLPIDAPPAALRGLAEGLWLASYRFRLPRPDGLGPDEGTTLEEVLVVVPDPARCVETLTAARVTAARTNFARDLTNMPSSVKNPAWFAEQMQIAAAEVPGLVVRVREPDELASEGFGGILAVGGGSASGPRLVEIDWRPADARTHVVLVGKGITFDTGGISIKPRDGMKLMRKDMGGAAAVVAAAIGAAELRLPVRITALAPLAENMVSGSAYRPGDVICHYGGMTSESTNSDAEGRLVLADVIAYAVARLEPDLLVDLATLTGANAVALGKRTAALYSENDRLAEAISTAATAAGERAWRMPLPTDYVEYLGSDVADLHSAPTQGAGSVLAALYLREFTGDWHDRWAHLDMSAPSWAEGDEGELVKGATGWGVRTLLRWLSDLSATELAR